MTNEERDIITRFIERVGGAPQTSFSGSVPATQQPALPPVDREADQLIGEMFTRYPDARYRLTQTAFVQESALAEAQNRIKRLEWELQQARQAPPQGQTPSRGFFGNLFGGGGAAPQQGAPPPGYGAPPPGYQPPQYAPPPPQYAQGYQPGMFQRSGSGFLGSALTTAAGVAGGMVVGNALMDLFSPHHSFGGGFGGGAPDIIPVDTGSSPWGGGQDANAAGWDNQTESGGQNLSGGWDSGGAPDNSTSWDQGGAPDAGSGWDAGGGDSGGGWDTSNC